MNHELSRRRFLRGLGISLGLPFLESIAPIGKALAATASKAASTHSGGPLRMACLYVPHGVNVARWKPTGEGADYQLGETRAPLAGVRSRDSCHSPGRKGVG